MKSKQINTQPLNEVAMQVNQANLVKSLRFSFTNQTTVVGELMLNSRRAQATQVKFNYCAETNVLDLFMTGH